MKKLLFLMTIALGLIFSNINSADFKNEIGFKSIGNLTREIHSKYIEYSIPLLKDQPSKYILRSRKNFNNTIITSIFTENGDCYGIENIDMNRIPISENYFEWLNDWFELLKLPSAKIDELFERLNQELTEIYNEKIKESEEAQSKQKDNRKNTWYDDCIIL